MKKPNLKIKTSPQTALEKDNEKLGKCMHPDEEVLPFYPDSPSKSSLECDFNPENNVKHPLFEDKISPALHCVNCGALICRECYTATPVPSPISENELEYNND